MKIHYTIALAIIIIFLYSSLLQRVYYCPTELRFIFNDITMVPEFNISTLTDDLIVDVDKVEMDSDGVFFCPRSQPLPRPTRPPTLAPTTVPLMTRCPRGGPTRRSEYETNDQNVCRIRCFTLVRALSQPGAYRRERTIFNCCPGYKPNRSGPRVSFFFSFVNTNRYRCIKE